jgi:hypothetical protein
METDTRTPDPAEQARLLVALPREERQLTAANMRLTRARLGWTPVDERYPL